MRYFNSGSDMTKIILKTIRLAVVCGIGEEVVGEPGGCGNNSSVRG